MVYSINLPSGLQSCSLNHLHSCKCWNNNFTTVLTSRISFEVYFQMSLVPMWKIRHSGCPFEIGFNWSYTSVIFAHGNCLTFTNCFWESKLPSFPFNVESPTMQMVHSGYVFGVSLAGRLPSCVTGVTQIGVFSSGCSGIASLFRLLFRYLFNDVLLYFWIALKYPEYLYAENLQLLYYWRHL